MYSKEIPFPDSMPKEYFSFDEDIRYNPETHLQLEWPEKIWSLQEFGYNPDQIATCASEVAVTSPFRLLSAEGVNALYDVVTRLKSVRTELSGNRTPSHLAGGVYRSRFLKDLCACPVILEHMSRIAGTRLITHSMPSQQMYVNYAPDDISKAVDAWHYDGIGFDYVIMASDPKALKGGNFEYFKGTRNEISEMFDVEIPLIRKGITEELDRDRVIQVAFPGAGYAIFQQGNMVIHRAARLLEPAERITVVPGLISENLQCADPTSIHDMLHYNESGVKAEIARHTAYLARGKLDNLITSQKLDAEDSEIIEGLKDAIEDVTSFLNQMTEKDSMS